MVRRRDPGREVILRRKGVSRDFERRGETLDLLAERSGASCAKTR
jgi:hypothetical protein